MLLKTIRRALSLCFLFSIFGIVAMLDSRTNGSEYAVKTITTEYGDIYDCVDFYKQPAFNHPLLKNHSFHPQMRPTFQPQRIRNSNVAWKMNATAADITPLKDGGCPQGTVPIRRMNKSSGLSETKVHPQRSSKTKNPNSATEYISGTILAISQTKNDPSKVYNGVGAVISVYKPRVFPSQYSSAQITVRSGSDFITAGWTVNPNKYRDDQTRFFVYAVAGDMRCFDTECGFVLVRSDYPLDFKIAPVSRRGDEVFVFKFFIYRDQASGVWWLQFGMDEPKITLGFWPQKIFSGLQSPATSATCGGEAYTLATEPPPEMGSGYYPDAAAFMLGDTYCTDFVVVDGSNNIVNADNTEPYGNNHVYGVFDNHMRDGQHVITFGGPY